MKEVGFEVIEKGKDANGIWNTVDRHELSLSWKAL